MDILLSKNTPRSPLPESVLFVTFGTTSEQSTTESQTWSDRELDGACGLVREPNQINSVFDGLSCIFGNIAYVQNKVNLRSDNNYCACF